MRVIRFPFDPLPVHLPYHASSALVKAAIGGVGPQSVETPVLTPNGWAALGSVRPGDCVIGADGRPTRVLATHPQGLLPLYRVVFSDGGSTLACANHQWKVLRRIRRRDKSRPKRGDGGRWRHPEMRGREAVTVATTALDFKSVQRDSLPALGPVQFAPQLAPVIDPYVLGALLGDGSFRNGCRFTTMDEALDAELRRHESCGRRQYRAGNQAWSFGLYGLCPRLRALGLYGHLSQHKFVPANYLLARPEQRLALLQGLMDTDGSSSGDTNEFCSASWRLARDVQELAWSLGCTARLSSGPSSLNGRRYLDRHRVYIVPPAGVALFRLSRKPTYRPKQLRYGRYVANVEPEGEGEAVCITVAAADGLYVTEDYIVTHNSGKTAALCMEGIRFALAQPGSDMLLTRRTIPDLRRSTEKELFEVMPTELAQACSIKRLGGHVESIRFPNRSLLTLVGMETWETHKSQNLAWIGVDEASEQTQVNFEGILTRLRQTKPLRGAPPLRPGQKMFRQVALASNPAGQDWLWSQFVNPATRRPDSSVHLSTPMDNPYLPPEYIDMLLQMPIPYIRRFVECRFDAAAGRVYPEWGWETHVLPVRAPGAYGPLVWMAMDPGVLAPTAGLWAEVDKTNGRLVAVSEYMEAGRKASDHAGAWRARERSLLPSRVVRRIADPNITKRDQGTTMELSDIYQRLGFSFERGPVRQDVRIPALANAIAAGQLVCTEACPQLYEQILNARWEDQLPRLRDLGDFRETIKKGNDHLHDCAQYLASIHVRVPLPTAAPPPVEPPIDWNKVEADWHKERCKRHARELRGLSEYTPGDGVVC